MRSTMFILAIGVLAVAIAGCKPQTPAANVNAQTNVQIEGGINIGGETDDGAMEKKEDGAMMKKEEAAMMKDKAGSADEQDIEADLKAMGEADSDAELKAMENEINAE